MPLMLESWSQLGRSSQAARQEAAQPRGCACTPCADGGRAPTPGVLLAWLASGCGGQWLCSPKGPGRPGLSRVSHSRPRRGEKPPAGTSLFQDLHSAAAAFPGLGAMPGASAIPLAKEKHRGARGALSRGDWAKKCELCSCQISSCFSLSFRGRHPGFCALQGSGVCLDGAGGAAAASGGECGRRGVLIPRPLRGRGT